MIEHFQIIQSDFSVSGYSGDIDVRTVSSVGTYDARSTAANSHASSSKATTATTIGTSTDGGATVSLQDYLRYDQLVILFKFTKI